mgnify:CR=1 FL=1
MSKNFEFSVVLLEKKKKIETIIVNGLSIISANNKIDKTKLLSILLGKNLDAKELRKGAWDRKIIY